MSFERIINLALRAYPRELRESRGAEMRDTALQASGTSRVKVLREGLALASAGMSARVLGASIYGSLSLRAVVCRVARTYAGAWRSLLSASALYLVTNTACGWATEQTAVPTVTRAVSAIVAIGVFIVWVVALGWFAAFVISRGVSIEREGRDGVRAALSAARSTTGEMVLILFAGTIALAVAANIGGVLGVAIGLSPTLGGVTKGGMIGGTGAAGALLLVALLTLWSVALPVIVIENPESMRSFARSRELVRGNGLRALAVVVVVLVVVEAARLVGGVLTGAAGEIGAMIVWLPVAPIPLLAATALYLELDEAPSRLGRTA
jgi:hypothetical protein